MTLSAMYDYAEDAARELERYDDHLQAKAIRQLVREHREMTATLYAAALASSEPAAGPVESEGGHAD